MLTTIRYVLLTAFRDWLFVGLFLALMAAFGISIFMGNIALVEEIEMSIVFAAGSTRVILLVGLIVFVCFHVRTAFQNREIELLLSRPISRVSFVLAYWMGFSYVAILLVIALATAFFFMPVDLQGLLYWTISLSLEALFVVAFAIFAALILNSAVSAVLLCFGFYFISRLMGFFLFILDRPVQYDFLTFDFMINKTIAFVSFILPRLDLYSKSHWLIYNVSNEDNFSFLFMQTAIYIPFLLAIALYDFKRKQF